jgi:hypothetical protein
VRAVSGSLWLESRLRALRKPHESNSRYRSGCSAHKVPRQLTARTGITGGCAITSPATARGSVLTHRASFFRGAGFTKRSISVMMLLTIIWSREPCVRTAQMAGTIPASYAGFHRPVGFSFSCCMMWHRLSREPSTAKKVGEELRTRAAGSEPNLRITVMKPGVTPPFMAAGLTLGPQPLKSMAMSMAIKEASFASRSACEEHSVSARGKRGRGAGAWPGTDTD